MKSHTITIVFLLVFAGYVSAENNGSLRLYRMAADHGSADGQYSLGELYRTGSGVTRDFNEARRWFRDAANQGYTKAQYRLGLMYMNGEGVAVDSIEAYKWFAIAASMGHEQAIKQQGLVADTMAAAQIVQANELIRAWMKDHAQ
ncbi:MAG: sel1 repeat family protein [Pseudomonadales bacterium]|nr:sel1 repeat family protein [Pseudomonadales bacterium]